ncbi:MAG: hypothetical protein M1818_006565 [Claussenomyces sp. TS43310]|nr:MAG: hypothetical protein M1818_006565 [Claussenomyces sp. TS43310]
MDAANATLFEDKTDKILESEDLGVQKEDGRTVSSSEQGQDLAPDGDLEREKLRITRKIDMRLIPILGLLYAISGIDRANLAVARLAGMDAELGMAKGSRYSIALLVFFITYFFTEVPSNLVLRKVGAARWLSFLTFAWGLSILGSGFAHNWTVIVGVRILVGAFEGGFVPGALYLISCWYERYQIQKRISLFYALSLVAGGFGSILAYGLKQMNGLAGFRGWRWIFIIEGLITVVLAVLGYLLIVDFPDKVYLSRRPFLTPREIEITKNRIDLDRGDSEHDPVTLKKLLHTLCRWQIWVYSLIFMGAGVASYAFSYFTPLILVGMRFTTTQVYLLSAPPNIAAIPYSFGCAWLADKFRIRAPFVIFQALTTIVGLMLTAYHPVNGVRYFGVFLGIAGANGNIPAILAWQANNIRGQSTRAIASGVQIAAGAIGGIYASTTFMQKEAPYYRSGLWATAATQFVMIIASICMTFYYLVRNRQAERKERVIEGLPSFRYTY